MTDTPRTVSAGDMIDGQEVQPKCEQTSWPGHWVCTVHGHLQHNLAALGGSHTNDRCKLAWMCHGHNALEVP